MNYTLELFDFLLEHPPIGLSAATVKAYEHQALQLRQQHATEEEVERVFIAFGKEAWPYRQAEHTFLAHLGNKQKVFLDALPESLREKWFHFEAAGGDIHNFRDGDAFEDAFTPEENQQIEQAMIEGHAAMLQQAKTLVQGVDAATYAHLVDTFSNERDSILAKCQELEELKKTSTKWAAEISDSIAFFHRGFAELEERPTEEKVQGKIDWYVGQLDVGNT
ncbi:MAG: hypothetical protein COU33_00865 [Candidatus Magasanikbacteria bacterium CG10_big_fil_rev_8_21_14_0_10_43_6]|uniref:Uncharacterized protein n=1 Tax=Candidatus Magasanikbacteria bacterium CG10_big_fil_rev_8_21_14_0_10_43_6 TaxID=1974650 RepID=A0A2M6W249_9BACT|nr:MAG: hypothetical protein COU33_00865 [Candidatus Magasanikbacteria bacterium CG10_big_fil_rev_8_21_14_0_10_43_6]